MTSGDLSVIVRSVAPVIRDYVTAALMGLTTRLADLEGRPVPRDGRDGADGMSGHDGRDGKDGRDGLDGKDGLEGAAGARGADGVSVDPVAVEALVVRHVAVAVSALPLPPAGQAGRDGIDGTSVDPVVVEALVVRHVAVAVSALPLPPAGQAGRDGIDGKDVSVDDVRALVASEVERRMAVLPPPTSVAGAVIDRDGHLVLTFSDGAVQTLGVVVGRDGLPGAPGVPGERGVDGTHGRDGFGFDDLSVESDGERTASFVFTRGDEVKRFPVRFGVPIYRGVFKAGTTYDRGDEVTWGGSRWTAVLETTAKPGESASESRAWVLSTQRGRDGKAGPEGKPGPRGPQGEPGPPGRSGY